MVALSTVSRILAGRIGVPNIHDSVANRRARTCLYQVDHD